MIQKALLIKPVTLHEYEPNLLNVNYQLYNINFNILLLFKLMRYKALLLPICLYGCQIYGPTKQSVTTGIQQFQSKFLRNITDTTRFVTNTNFHQDLRITYINDIFHKFYRRFKDQLNSNKNPFILNLTSTLPGIAQRC